MANTVAEVQAFIAEVNNVIKSANRLDAGREVSLVLTKLQEAQLWAQELISKVDQAAKSVGVEPATAAETHAATIATNPPVDAGDPTTAVPDGNPAGTPTASEAVDNEAAKEVAAADETAAPADVAASEAAAPATEVK